MIKDCKWCGRKFSGNGKQKYCPGGRCKKNYENSLRRSPGSKGEQASFRDTLSALTRPPWLNEVAAAFWDKLAPTLISNGVLNLMSEDAFAELCDLHSRRVDINRAINIARTPAAGGPGANGVDGEGGFCGITMDGGAKESALSELKRKYSKLWLEYCKEFNLTPRTNPRMGNGNSDGEKEETDSIFD